MKFFDLLVPCRTGEAEFLGLFVSIAMAETQHTLAPVSRLEGGNTYAIGLVFVLLAGLCWSLGGLLFRLISDANVWQVLFYRSVVLALTLVGIIAVINKGRLLRVLKEAGFTGIIAGFCMALSSLTYISSLTFTTVANASFMVGSVPFFSALLGWVLLREKVNFTLALAIAVAFCGIGLMVVNGFGGGKIIGSLLALYASLAFACFTVLLRWNGKVDATPAVFWGGILLALMCFPILLFPTTFDSGSGLSAFAISMRDIAICATMGVVQVGLGLVLYTYGAKHLQAAELGLMTLVEPVIGTFWVWLIVNERPDVMTLIGGAIILAAIAGHALSVIRKKKLPRSAL